jgi:ADP-ribosylglycohydrolase
MTLDADRSARLLRARLSLNGLAVGDAFGEQFFGPPGFVHERLARREVPPPTWPYTDDTAMAMSVVDILEEYGRIDQDALIALLARRHADDPNRGYGAGARALLRAIEEGSPWRESVTAMFGGQGSHGNGAAMRVAPLGAYFADDVDRLVIEASASAEVTHAHPDGQAGAIAVAVAAAYAWARLNAPGTIDGASLLAFVESRTPPGDVRHGIRKALAMTGGASVTHAATVLGSGSRVSAADTVPFALWCAARHFDDYEEALWTTVSGLGDRDTTCAIVGGIVALSAGFEAIPERWRISREALGLRYRMDTDDDEVASSR